MILLFEKGQVKLVLHNLKYLFFSFKGRINKYMFLGMHFLYFLVCLFVGLVLSLVLIVVGGTEVIHTFGASPESDFGPIEFLCLLFGFISLYSYLLFGLNAFTTLTKAGGIFCECSSLLAVCIYSSFAVFS